MTISQTFTRRVREERERRGWSQAELSRRVAALGHKLDKDAMSKLEGGERRVTLDDGIALAAALDVPLHALLLGEPDEEMELTPELRVRTPFVASWLAGAMALDPADVELYEEAGKLMDEARSAEEAILRLAALRDLSERERKMTQAVIEMNLSGAADFERLARRLDPGQAERVRDAARIAREKAAELRALLDKEES
jgi:transcriptional regulator with XRE-family HTH domain